MVKIGQPKKYLENLDASSVADVTMSFRSGRFWIVCLSRPNSTSVLIVRSCASSSMITEYCDRFGSSRHWRSSMPSVMYAILVSGLVQSSKRIVYPTSWPRRQPNSSATRLATDMAATRRGCVHPILPLSAKPSSARYCVICVVLPEPVSPMTTSTWFCAMACTSSERNLKIGSDSRCSLIDMLVTRPYVTFLPIDAFFHSGTSCDGAIAPRRSAANVRSPAAGIGSCQGLLRSFGIASVSMFFCASRSSRRSLASAACVSAARCSDPSGFLTILIGDMSTASRVVPRRNSGSSSTSSTSMFSSLSSMLSTPCSSSNVGISVTLSTPDAASCFSSQRSGDEMRLARLGATPSSLITGAFAKMLAVAGRSGLRASASSRRRGLRSAPVAWSTSFIVRLMRVPAIESTFTLTAWLRLTTCDASITRAPDTSCVICTRPSRRPRMPSSDTNTPKSRTPVTLPS
eukprot:Unigene2682_Nuclearia_a/m.8299 Unigene2682_Nuclearia_a/g.8299  ORF Unigene2682_Nuclearia_a/g.8299 Unigene2682_Nuclearia_a/m.8299 type:complete len:460 (-) Unigene2682_Nuclearia_a:363-1742(-)